MAMVTMTMEEIMAVTDEEIEREIAEVKAMPPIPDDGEDDCPIRTMEQLRAMGWHRVNPRKREA